MDPDNDGGAGAPADDDARPEVGADTQPSTGPVDIDDLALQEALAAAEAEDRGDTPNEQQEAGVEDAAPEAPEASPQKAPGPVPYPRFQEVNSELREARERLAYVEGQVQALLAKGGGTPSEAAADTSPAERQPAASIPAQVKALRAEVLAAAEQFDAGEITLAEFETKRAAADDAIADLNIRVAAEIATQNAGPSLADKTVLATHAQALDAAYPAIKALKPEQLQRLARIVMQDAADEGKPFGTSAEETMRLRTVVAERAAEFAAAVGVSVPASSGPQTTNPAGKPSLSPAAQARAAKHAMAAGMPPDTSSMGSSGGADDPYSEARIAAMTDDEIAALPSATRARILTR